ncbi:MAG: EpsG family protein [Pyrinomonadaceae bacterium]
MSFEFVWPIYAVFIFLTVSGGTEMLIKQGWVKQLAVFSSVIALVLLAALRSIGVGSDDVAYADMFANVPVFFGCDEFLCGYSYSQFNVELGFFTLLSMLRAFGNEPYVLFSVVALASVALNVRAIKFFSPHVGSAILVYFCHFYLNKELNAIRLGLASAILFWAVTLIPVRKTGMFILLVICAAFVHVSSLLILLPFAIYQLRPSRSVYAAVALALLAFTAFFDIQTLFSYLINFGFIGEKINLYLNADIYNFPLPLLSAVNLKNLIFVGVALAFWRQISGRYEHFELVFCFFFCATFIRIALGDFAIVAGRSYAAISMFEYVMLPFVVFSLCGKWLGYALIVLYAGLTLYLNLTDNAGWSGEAVQFFNFNN